MTVQMNNLSINRIAIHQIYERDENREVRRPKYNNVMTRLPEDGLSALCERVTTALGNNSHSLQMDIVKVDIASTFQMMAKMLYLDDGRFLEESKKLADKLAQCQSTRRIPGGILVVFDGTVGNDELKYIATIKAESQGGFALEAADNVDILLRYISELLLTPQQKLYKIGLFIERNPNIDVQLQGADDFYATIYDQNMNNAETRNAALYFYESFLGCVIHASNKKLTRDFYNNTKEFISTLNVADEQKVDLSNSLYDYLKMSRETIISVNDFATRYFDPRTIDTYKQHMRSKNFPANAISKDIEYLKNKLRRRQIKFTSKVKITAPSDNFHQLVRVVTQNENETTLCVQGKIEEQ